MKVDELMRIIKNRQLTLEVTPTGQFKLLGEKSAKTEALIAALKERRHEVVLHLTGKVWRWPHRLVLLDTETGEPVEVCKQYGGDGSPDREEMLSQGQCRQAWDQQALRLARIANKSQWIALEWQSREGQWTRYRWYAGEGVGHEASHAG